MSQIKTYFYILCCLTIICSFYSFKNAIKERTRRKSGAVNLKLINITLSNNRNITFEYKVPLKNKNQARVLMNTGDSSTNCMKLDKTSPNDVPNFTLVTWYVPIDSRHWFIYGRHLNEEEKEARTFEIISTYQKNLNHPLIKNVFILAEHWESVQFLQHIDFNNSSKLVIVWSKNGITHMDVFNYMFRCLQGEIAMFANSDISIGEGFQKVNPKIIRDNKLMYALTRHSTYYDTYGTCNEKFWLGAIDSYYFYVRRFNSTDFKLISSINKNEAGTENVIIYMFREELGWTVINPCKILKTYHQHKVNARRDKGPPINKNYSAEARITDQLF